MSGTTKSGKAAEKTNKKRHGADFYKVIGALGGRQSTTGGFYGNRELARRAGRLGGLKSRRSGVKDGQGQKYERKPQIDNSVGGHISIGDLRNLLQ